MGLKLITFNPPKSGKTVFGLSMAEMGPIGALDLEGRFQWYLEPHPTIKPRDFPFDQPMRLRDNLPMLERNEVLAKAWKEGRKNVVYMANTGDLSKIRLACRDWNRNKDIIGIDLDTASIIWDLLMATRDTSDERMSRLSWAPVKEWDKLFKIGLTAGNKHVNAIAQAQERLKLVKDADGSSRFIVEKIVPRMEKFSQHWADMTVSLTLGANAPHPTLIVVDEGTGGWLRRGEKLENPTFRRLLELLKFVPEESGMETPDKEQLYRNKNEILRVREA